MPPRHQPRVDEKQRSLPESSGSQRSGDVEEVRMKRWTLAHALVLGSVSMALCGQALAQESYPTRTIRIIVPTAPGGPSDVGARLIAAELQKRWGRPVVVETRPGAGTIIGSEAVARAAPDGYTLLLSPSTLATNPASYRKMPYDALTDFAPITQTHFVPNLFVTHPGLPAKTTKEFVALARARPNEILYGSAGHGTNPHLTIELFASMAGVQLYHVPYKGTLPGLTDLLAGRIVMMATSAMSLLVPHVNTGKLRALGVSSAKRSQALPEVPSIAEAVPGYEAVQWSALMAPAGTSQEIVRKLHKEVVAVLHTAEIKARLNADSAEIVGSTPEELAAFLRAETEKWARVAKRAGIEPQ
jgi:tripartite-type tricarboxylate transporter receptor subunit TctC